MVRNNDVERIAETHFALRPMLVNTLKKSLINPDPAVRQIAGNYDTYFDMWQAGFGDRFFDMGTMVRLGTAIETGLRAMHQAYGHTASRGLYQRIVNPQDVQRRFLDDCGYDLAGNAYWQTMREIMLHRHLYAHRSGLVDESYIADLKSLTGVDIEPEMIRMGYPTDEVYYFKPLDLLNDYIESARRFFRELPDGSNEA